MAIIWFIFIIFPCHCAVYMYKITILQKPLSQFPPNFTLILLLKCDWESLFKWSCSIDCQAHIFFFKTKNCSNDDIFISCDDRIGKMLHNICMSAVAMSLRWANRGPWASCILWYKLLQTSNEISASLQMLLSGTKSVTTPTNMAQTDSWSLCTCICQAAQVTQ